MSDFQKVNQEDFDQMIGALEAYSKLLNKSRDWDLGKKADVIDLLIDRLTPEGEIHHCSFGSWDRKAAQDTWGWDCGSCGSHGDYLADDDQAYDRLRSHYMRNHE